MSNYTSNDIINAIAAAAKALEARKDEINRLNVFPVPDGDTGTNMSLTLAMVVDNLAKLPIGASSEDRRRAITTGALMGARGNSGVITSQIMRGLCEGIADHEEFDIVAVDDAFSRAVEFAFNAVRKPVEGTILTVLRDTATAAHKARKKKMELDEGLQFIVGESYASVQRTPELLPVLKENGVVDAGGFGIAIFFDSFVASLTGRAEAMVDELAFARTAAPKVEIEQINDWEGSKYKYCNEFLVNSETLDPEEALDFLQTMGDCELCVGSTPKFKVHVHSNTPDKVLAYFLERGEIFEVFIHNMKLQSEERTEKLEAEQEAAHKAIGFVTTKSVPEAFSALFAFDEDATLEENVEAMTEACEDVKTGEITRAIKDSKDVHGNPIHDGDVIGIADGDLEVVSDSIEDATIRVLEAMDAEDADTLTILAGEDYSDEEFEALLARIEEEFEDLEIDSHRGEQPLYPIVLSVE